MTDIGFGMMDKRSVAAILFALALAGIIGLKIPIDTSSFGALFVDIVLLTGALYAARSMLRLPVIVAVATKKRYSRNVLDASEYAYDYEFYSDYREKKILRIARIFDRFALVGLVFLACTPSLRPFVTIAGVVGLVFMLLVYIFTNSFSFFVRDAVDAAKKREEDLADRTAAKVTVTQEDPFGHFNPG
jgi:hypothetical protein